MQLFHAVPAADRQGDPPDPRDASILFGTVGAQAFRHRGDQVGCQLGVLFDDCSSLRFRPGGVEDLAGKVSRV